MLVDSHCHLDMFPSEERQALLARANEAGIGEMVSISTRLDQAASLIAMVSPMPGVWCTIGVHPHNAHEAPVPTVETLAALTSHDKVVGIGESGLDYFYDKAPKPIQQASFRAHIRAAQRTQLPLVIHARDADEDIATILKEEWDQGGAYPFLLHCFSSGRALAETALSLGGYISFSGILTFPKSTGLREIARDIPLDRMLVETDAPYLAPAPFRGKRNEPAYVARTAAILAEVKAVSAPAMAETTTRNFHALFKKTTADRGARPLVGPGQSPENDR